MHPPRIERLRVQNYRVLRDIDVRAITPLTVLVGPNGSGKSTVFDVLAFLSECFTDGLRRAWDRRGRFRELRSRDADGPIVIELRYRESTGSPLVTYRLEIDEKTERQPIVAYERLRWKRGSYGQPYSFLEFRDGEGFAISGELPDESAAKVKETLSSPETLAVNTLGQFERHPRVGALREFITGWHLSYLSADDPRRTPEAGPQEHLSKTGSNLANVVQYLGEQHPGRLKRMIGMLCSRVPGLDHIDAQVLADGRLLLQIKDTSFERPILAKYASDGTLKLLAYLVLINDPEPAPLIGIEEPENYLHPKLLPGLAEECTLATRYSQLMVTTHSPFFLSGLLPDQVRILDRGHDGYSRVVRAADIEGIAEFMKEGADLGDLWMEGHYGVGDPLAR